MYDDDDDMLCTTDPNVRLNQQRGESGEVLPTTETGALDVERLGQDLRDVRLNSQLHGCATTAEQLQLELQATQSSTDAKKAISSASKRQVVPLSASGNESARRTTQGSVASSARLGSGRSDASRVVGLEDELRAVQNQLKIQDRTIQQLTQENDKQQKMLTSLSNKLERESVEKKDLEQKLRLIETQYTAAKKEVIMLQRQQQSTTTDDARLQRALQEIEKLRSQLGGSASATGGGTPLLGSTTPDLSEVTHLRNENKKLEAQRLELINCVRKQNKLIDILKRQKMHLEAAKLLQLTEEEFTKILEINHK